MKASIWTSSCLKPTIGLSSWQHVGSASFEGPLPQVDKAVCIADKFGLNAGVFFLKIDLRSLRFLNDILLLGELGIPLEFFEQTAMQIAIEERGLEARGEFVRFPMSIFNSYAGRRAIDHSMSVFQLHFPSLRFKRSGMLPLLESLRDGHTVLQDSQAVEEALYQQVKRFWADRRKKHKPK